MFLESGIGLKERAVHIAITLVLSLTCNAAIQADLDQLYLEVTESSVDFFEPLWTDYSDTIPYSGYFDFSRYRNWRPNYVVEITIPGSGQVAYCYAVLLRQSDKKTFGKRNVARSTLLDHAVRTIRFCCLTSGYADNPFPYPLYKKERVPYVLPEGTGGGWSRKQGMPIDVLGYLSLAVVLLWEELDGETRAAAEAMMVGNALKKREFAGWVPSFGGWHDRMKQDFSSTVGAAYLFPRRGDHETLRNIIAGQALDMVATEHDQAKVRIHYAGQCTERVTVLSENGERARTLLSEELSADRGFVLKIQGTTEIRFANTDETAPAVEFVDIDIREDGRVNLVVDAADQSGVESVELTCDGIPVGRKSNRPYRFMHFPDKGWHTYEATARDRAAPCNERRSVKRTVEVVFGKARSNRYWEK